MKGEDERDNKDGILYFNPEIKETYSKKKGKFFHKDVQFEYGEERVEGENTGIDNIDLYDSGLLKHPHRPEEIASNLILSIVSHKEDSIRVQLFEEPIIIAHQTMFELRATESPTAIWTLLLQVIVHKNVPKDQDQKKAEIQRKQVEDLNGKLVAFVNKFLGCRISSRFQFIEYDRKSKQYIPKFTGLNGFKYPKSSKNELLDKLKEGIANLPTSPNSELDYGRLGSVYDQLTRVGIEFQDQSILSDPAVLEAAEMLQMYESRNYQGPRKEDGHYRKRRLPTSDDQ